MGIDYGVCKRCVVSRDRVYCCGLIYGALEIRHGVLFGITARPMFEFYHGKVRRDNWMKGTSDPAL